MPTHKNKSKPRNSKGKGGTVTAYMPGKGGGIGLAIAIIVLLVLFFYWNTVMETLGLKKKDEENETEVESMNGKPVDNRQFRPRIPKEHNKAAVKKVKEEAKKRQQIRDSRAENMDGKRNPFEPLNNDHIGVPYPSGYHGNVSKADSERIHIRGIDEPNLLNYN